MEKTALKILFVIPTQKVDKPEIMSFAKRLAVSLEALGTHVDIMMSVKSGNPLNFIRIGKDLQKNIRLNRPDLVVAQYGTFTGLLVALFAPHPKLITYRGSDLNPTPSENRLYVLLKHVASHIASFSADGIVCVSREVAGRLLFKRTVEIIPSSTDTELFQPIDKSMCRESLGWDQDVPTAIFFVGNNPGKKRLDTALAVEKLLEGNPDGVLMKLIREEIPLPLMPLYLNAADCLVYLSSFEGSPNLIREACACGTPIVTVPVGDVAEVLDGVKPGMIVERDAGRIAEAVCRVASLRTRSNGRIKALNYSCEITARRTLEFYEKIVRQQRSYN